MKITIIGCGWVGMPLGAQLSQTGHHVLGTTRSQGKAESLRQKGINPYVLTLPEADDIDSELLNVDAIVIAIPPGRRDPKGPERYQASIKLLIDKALDLGQRPKVVLISSTSVYDKTSPVITEDTPTKPQTDSARAILGSEQLISESGLDYVILRFGGLAGPGRHPGRFFAGKTNVNGGEQPINFLHLTDAVNAIQHVIEQPIQNELFNVVAPMHPTREEFYRKMTADLDLPIPTFSSSGKASVGLVSSEKISEQTNFTFAYPDPMQFDF